MNKTVIIIMIICATVIALVAIICDHLFERKSTDASECLLSKKIIKVHRNYIAGFLGFAVIMLLTSQYGGPANAIFAYLSFGSTITSLVLSILAIFVTVQSSSDLYKQFTRIDNATDTIKNVSTQIDGTLEKLINVEGNLNNVSDLITRQINGVVEKIDQKLASRMHETEVNISKQIKMQNFLAQKMMSSKQAKPEIEKLNKENFLKKIPYNGLITLYACAKAFENKKKFKMSFFKDNELYHLGIIMASVASGYLNANVKDEDDGNDLVYCDFSAFSSDELYDTMCKVESEYATDTKKELKDIDKFFIKK